MSEAFYSGLWQAVVAAIVTIVLALIAERTKRAVEAARASAELAAILAAGKAAEVKVEAKKMAVAVNEVRAETKEQTEKLDSIVVTANQTHVLVNDRHGKALQALATLARWKANQPNSDASDDDAANVAEKVLEDHREKQRIVDRNSQQDSP